MTLIPTPQLLAQISNYASSKGGKNYCLFLLGSKAGLRVSEAVIFNHNWEHNRNFYQVKSKGKERSAYVSKQVISELKKHHWKPNNISRHGFYKFLKRTKKALNISQEIELTPHTLRRCFATYHANNGVPMTVLQKALGHSSIRTTSLYWRDTEPVNNLIIRGWLDKSPLPNGEIKTEPISIIIPNLSKNIPETSNNSPEICVSSQDFQKPVREINQINSKKTVEFKAENADLIPNTPQTSNPLKTRKITTENPQQIESLEQNELTRLREENKQLRTQIKQLKILVNKLQEQQKIEVQIECWKPKSNHD